MNGPTEKQESNVITLGHNNPPSPFDEIKAEITGLYEEAINWCDGEAIASQDVADEIDKLVGLIKDASKRAETLRKEEVKPFDDEKKAIQAKFNELIGDTKTVTGLAVKAVRSCNMLLTPWKQKLEAERLAKVEAECKEAEEKTRLAAQAIQQSAGNLEAREAAEEQRKEAERLTKSANRTAKQTVKGMRTVRSVKITNMRTLAAWFWEHKRDDLEAFMLEKVTQYNRAGQRGIPGIEVKEERVAR